MKKHKALHVFDKDLDSQAEMALRELLVSCFPHETKFRKQRYNNEIPLHRWFVYADGEPVAHLATHEKQFVFEGQSYTFCGIAEVCVREDHRGQGLVGMLLQQAELRHASFHFSILLGDTEVYERYGYTKVSNVYFLSHSPKPNPDAMIKCLRAENWPTGDVFIDGPRF